MPSRFAAHLADGVGRLRLLLEQRLNALIGEDLGWFDLELLCKGVLVEKGSMNHCPPRSPLEREVDPQRVEAEAQLLITGRLSPQQRRGACATFGGRTGELGPLRHEWERLAMTAKG